MLTVSLNFQGLSHSLPDAVQPEDEVVKKHLLSVLRGKELPFMKSSVPLGARQIGESVKHYYLAFPTEGNAEDVKISLSSVRLPTLQPGDIVLEFMDDGIDVCFGKLCVRFEGESAKCFVEAVAGMVRTLLLLGPCVSNFRLKPLEGDEST